MRSEGGLHYILFPVDISPQKTFSMGPFLSTQSLLMSRLPGTQSSQGMASLRTTVDVVFV